MRRPAPLLQRSRFLTLAVAAILALEVAGAATVVRRRDDLVSAPTATTGAAPRRAAAAQRRAFDERESQVRRLLADRSRAVLSRDRALFLRGIDPGATAFRARQERLFDALADVPIGSWAYTLDPDREWPFDPAVLGHYRAETWVPEIELRYQLKGYDALPATGEQFLTFVRRPQGWLIGNDDDFPGVPNLQTDRELWDFGPVEVVTGRSSLVLGRRGRRDLLTEIARQADLAVPRVSAVWGRDWSQKVVVLVPETQDELGTLIEEGNDLSQIAAVAVAQLGRRGDLPAAVGNRIIVNPPNFARLSRAGRRIVLQHEITHVASRRLHRRRDADLVGRGVRRLRRLPGFGRAHARRRRRAAVGGPRRPPAGDIAPRRRVPRHVGPARAGLRDVLAGLPADRGADQPG